MNLETERNKTINNEVYDKIWDKFEIIVNKMLSKLITVLCERSSIHTGDFFFSNGQKALR